MYTNKNGFAQADFDPKTVVTIPNIVTLIRLIILPFILVSLSRNQNIQAFVLILVAGFTDVLDGFLAKILNQATTIGKILDPIVDKICVIAILVFLYLYRDFPFWGFYTIIVFEIAILIGGYILILRHKIIPSSNIFGKLAMLLISLGIYMYVVDIKIINNFSLLNIPIKILTVAISALFLLLATVKYGISSLKEINKYKKTTMED